MESLLPPHLPPLATTTMTTDNSSSNSNTNSRSIQKSILLIQGFGSILNHYRYQYDAMSNASYKCIWYRHVKFGASDKPPFDYDIMDERENCVKTTQHCK